MNEDTCELRTQNSFIASLCLCILTGTLLLLSTGCSRTPEPIALEFGIEEDNAIEITLTSTQPDKTDIQYQISTLPQHGTVEGVPPRIRYTPDTNYIGTDEFEYVTLRGTQKVSDPATVTISISAINDAPVVTPLKVTTITNTTVIIEPKAHDVDGFIRKFAIAVSPTHGQVKMEGSQFVYTPDAGFNGNDSFDYLAVDSEGLTSNTATVSISISPLRNEPVEKPTESQEPTEVETESEPTISIGKISENTKPIAADLEVLLLEDTSFQIEFKANAAAASIASYGVTSMPSHGTLNGVGSIRTYTPNTDFFGTDSFQYVAIDDNGSASQPAVVSITVDPVNDAPIAKSSQETTTEDSQGITLSLEANDSDGSITSFKIVVPPTYGRLENWDTGRVSYIPNRDFNGLDTFQWVAVDDSGAQSRSATITLEVVAQPDRPSVDVRHSHIKTIVGDTIHLNVNATDPDGDLERFEIATYGTFNPNGKFWPGQRGSINELGRLRFEATETGTHRYDIHVFDRSGLSTVATLTIEVTPTPPVVELPIPSYDRANGTVQFTLRARDPDGTIDHFVIQTIDNRRASSIKVNGSTITDAQPFTTGDACETQDEAWCTLNVVYTPDEIDGHSRRIRVYVVDVDGLSSPKDFIRIETNQLEKKEVEFDIDKR